MIAISLCINDLFLVMLGTIPQFNTQHMLRPHDRLFSFFSSIPLNRLYRVILKKKDLLLTTNALSTLIKMRIVLLACVRK